MRRAAVFAIAAVLLVSLTGCQVEYSDEMTSPAAEETTEEAETDNTLRIRYCDEKYTDYLNYCRNQFESSHSGIKVELEKVSADDYIQKLNDDSVSGKKIPDVFIADNSDLSMLYLAGLASQNTSDRFTSDNYSDAALRACSYGDKLIAYPLSYRTSFLVYNSDYISKENVNTFDDLREYSSNVEFGEEGGTVERIFGCDLGNIFGNFGFVGNGVDIGGSTGENKDEISFYNDKTLEAAQEYLSIVDYFHLNMDLSYEECLQEFSSGAMLATIMYTDSVADTEGWQINYDVADIPDYNDSVPVRPLSSTECIVVNMYSPMQQEAAYFAELASFGNADVLFEKTGCLSARRNVSYGNEKLEKIYDSYDKSVPQNKLLYGDQAYPRLEIALHNIIAGNDMSEELKNVDEYMKNQMQ